MKLHTVYAVLVLIMSVLAGTASSAAEIVLYSPPLVDVNFDGSKQDIPVLLTGPEAVLQLVIVTAPDIDIPPWIEVELPTPEERFVQGLDPLVYVGPQQLSQAGHNTVTWYGQDMDGHIVPMDHYRYYVLAFNPESVPESQDYENTQRGDILSLSEAIISGILQNGTVSPDYPLTHFTDFPETSSYATVSVSDIFNSLQQFPVRNLRTALT